MDENYEDLTVDELRAVACAKGCVSSNSATLNRIGLTMLLRAHDTLRRAEADLETTRRTLLVEEATLEAKRAAHISSLLRVSHLDATVYEHDRTACHNATCSKQTRLHHCAKCCDTVYCSRECQRADWPEHRRECVAAGPVIARSHLVTISGQEAEFEDLCRRPMRHIRAILSESRDPFDKAMDLVAIMHANAYAPNVLAHMEPAMPDFITLLLAGDRDRPPLHVAMGARAAQFMFAAHAGIRARWRANLGQAIAIALKVVQGDAGLDDDERIVSALRRCCRTPPSAA